MIPFVDLKTQYKIIKNKIDKEIFQVIENTDFIGGASINDFEKEFSKYLGIRYCIGVNSGTDALILGLRALDLAPNSEVIIPANTFLATALAATENGLKPVFVDIDENDYGINLYDLRKKINNRTKAIIIVHLYGQPDKLDEIRAIIKNINKRILIIEDACQAHGAEYKKRKVGNFGIFSAFSFYPGKNLGAYGDGGAIVTNNSSLEKKYRLLRQYGSTKKYYHDILGINSRLDTIQAAVLKVKLSYLDGWNKQRQKLALRYNNLLNKNKEIKTPNIFADRRSVFHLYVIRTLKRNALLEYLNKNSVQTLIHYPIPLHLQKAFKYLNYSNKDLPIITKISNEILSLPIFPELTVNDQNKIVKVLNNFYEQ